jgi:DNA-binding CsgD family transcriptional regulator
VSVNTVQTQVSRVMAKTGCGRQADVVVLLTGIGLPRTSEPS